MDVPHQTYSRFYPFREPETCSGDARSQGGDRRLLLERRLHGQRARVPTTRRPRFSKRQTLRGRNSALGGRRLSVRRGSRQSHAIRGISRRIASAQSSTFAASDFFWPCSPSVFTRVG